MKLLTPPPSGLPDGGFSFIVHGIVIVKRAYVFIDGSNLYHRVKSVAEHFHKETGQEYGTADFDFSGFCDSLKGETEIKSIKYYVGIVRRIREGSQDEITKSEKMYAAQQRLISHLESAGIELRYGKLLKYPGGVYHEKGVDVQLSVEMIRFARNDDYDVAYLLSSDSDLIPAVKEVKKIGKEVVYMGVKKIPTPEEQKRLEELNRDPFAISYGLMRTASDNKIVEKEEVIPFLKNRAIDSR